MQKYAPIVVRLGLAGLLLWFGAQQLIDPLTWSSYVPQFVIDILPFSGEALAMINGSIEVIFGILLLFGIFVRASALIMSIHIVLIGISLGYNSVAIRDFGLAIAAFGVFLYGPDHWSFDRRRQSQEKSGI